MRMTRRQHPEDDLHKAVAQYLELALPPECCWTTMPAGGGGKIRGARLKTMGFHGGWPDLQLVYKGRYIGIELKTGKNKLSDTQDATHERLTLAGGLVYTARSVEAVEGFLSAIMPLQATTGARAA